MTEFTAQAVALIDEHLEAVRDEMARLQAARTHLADGRAAASHSGGADSRPARHAQALELIKAKPGITAAELSRALPGRTYGYTLVKRLATDGAIDRCGDGWQVP